jgi:uncharacterized CHY-type Zn-finger protein
MPEMYKTIQTIRKGCASRLLIHNQQVFGNAIDKETRCAHYHNEIDRIAIKFYCCQAYFSCYICHEEKGCGSPAVWPTTKFHEQAVLCGSCGHELSISDYLDCKSTCPACNAAFNPGCSLHKHLYFADTKTGN